MSAYGSSYGSVSSGSAGSLSSNAPFLRMPPPPPPIHLQSNYTNNHTHTHTHTHSDHSPPPPPPPPGGPPVPGRLPAPIQQHRNRPPPPASPPPASPPPPTSGPPASGTPPPTSGSGSGSGSGPVLVVLGDTDVGKTSTILYYVTGQYYPNKTLATIEDSYRKVYSAGSGTSQIEIIDTAGAVGICAPLRHFYRKMGAAFAILYSVYNIDSWLRMVREYEEMKATERPILIIGTRSSYSPESQRKIPYQQLIEFGYRNGIPAREVDINSGVQIEKAYDQIVGLMLQSMRDTGRGEGQGLGHGEGKGHGQGSRKRPWYRKCLCM